MSYYSIDLSGRQYEWYRNTSEEKYAVEREIMDKHWNSTCDSILIDYVKKYGVFSTAFYDDIIRKIDTSIEADLYRSIRHYELYLSTKVYEIDKTKKLWENSYKDNIDTMYFCPYCNKDFPLMDCHPDILRTLGIPPTHCRTCNYVIERYKSFWNEDISLRVCCLMQNLNQKKTCELCKKEYSLENDIFTYHTFGKQFVDCLYPNLFLNICPKCFKKTFNDYKRGSNRLKLSRLYDLFVFTGKVPTQDFENLFYLYKDHNSLLELINIFQRLRTPQGYKEEFGSFFAALVKSGILPEGSRQMTFGTMVLAEDGHLCLSLPEKEIDDFLYLNGIPHDKEVFYPDSKMRTDWEILNTEKRTFVEYFGLMSNDDYAEKTTKKKKIAKSNGIKLIDIYPESDWEVLLSSFISNKTKMKQDR